MSFGDVVDEFHDEHRLTHAGTSEESDFSAFGIGFEQVNHLDAGEEHLATRFQVFELRRFAVDGIHAGCSVQFFQTIDGVSGHVHHSSFDLCAGRHGDGCAAADCFQSSAQSVGVVHRHGADSVLSDVLLHFEGDGSSVGVSHFQSLVDARQHFFGCFAFCVKSHIDHGADDLRNISRVSEFTAHKRNVLRII